MRVYVITYIYKGTQYDTVVRPTKGWESQFLQSVLYRIESLLMSGAVIKDLREFNYLE